MKLAWYTNTSTVAVDETFVQLPTKPLAISSLTRTLALDYGLFASEWSRTRPAGSSSWLYRCAALSVVELEDALSEQVTMSMLDLVKTSATITIGGVPAVKRSPNGGQVHLSAHGVPFRYLENIRAWRRDGEDHRPSGDKVPV